MRIAQINGMGKVWGNFKPSVLDDPSATVGGGEASLLPASFGPSYLGHEVSCYVPREGPETVYKGVRFVPLQRKMEAIDNADAIVGWNDHRILIETAKARPGIRRVFSQQLNHLSTDRAFWNATEVIISPAKMHAEYLVASFAPPGAPFRFVLMPSGIDTYRYVDQKPWIDRGNVVSYWSSPDRGLHHLLLAWSKISTAVFNADLRVFYHLAKFAMQPPNWTDGEVTWRSRVLYSLMHKMNFTAPGAVARSVLARHQMETRVMAYPFDPIMFTESFATSIGEGIAAGCRVVARPADALYEIWGDSVRWVEADVCDDDFRSRFADAVISALQDPEWPEEAVGKTIVAKYNWITASKQVEKACVTKLGPPSRR